MSERLKPPAKQALGYNRQAFINQFGEPIHEARTILNDPKSLKEDRYDQVENMIQITGVAERMGLDPVGVIYDAEDDYLKRRDLDGNLITGDVPPRNDAGGFEMKRRGW
jgi:hypothetical protein